ncbi:MAG: hypothetical protein ACRDPC_20880 [Solirubrobacteraceae bacterium]
MDGTVADILVDGSTAYVAGSFERIGPPTGPLALVSSTDGRVTRAFPGFTGGLNVSPLETHVGAIEPDSAGGWYVGGEFLRVDGRYRTSLVHLLADGSVDRRFRADVDGTVQALALDREEGTLWVGGHFSRVSGRHESSLVALAASTGAFRAWLPRGIDGEVNDIDIDGERVYLGGGFHTVAGDDQSGAAALSRRTGEPLEWDPEPGGAGWLHSTAARASCCRGSGTSTPRWPAPSRRRATASTPVAWSPPAAGPGTGWPPSTSTPARCSRGGRPGPTSSCATSPSPAIASRSAATSGSSAARAARPSRPSTWPRTR